MAPGLGLIIMLALAAFFYRAAEFEDMNSPVAWAAGSCLLYLGAIYGLDWGLCAAIALQVLLLIGMAAWMELGNRRREQSLAEILQDLRKTFSWSSFQARRYCAQGRCEHCGYDLRGNARPAACPECGTVAYEEK